MNEATENQEQQALFQWAEIMTKRHPELALLYSVPNGGYRHIATAVLLKKTGVKSGVPDIFLPVARGDKHGIFIEMKKLKGGVVSANQRMWLNALAGQGYRAVVCRGWEQARDEILNYLGGEE